MCYRRLLCLTTLLVSFVFIITACGKTGFPKPKDSTRGFSITNTLATPAGKCLAFTAQLEGAYQNLERIRLDLDFLNDPEDSCIGCPFVPKETVYFSTQEAGLNIQDGSLGFSYCPFEAKKYRWRLVGISKYSTVPHAISDENYTQMQAE